jgi:hypothetical protein
MVLHVYFRVPNTLITLMDTSNLICQYPVLFFLLHFLLLFVTTLCNRVPIYSKKKKGNRTPIFNYLNNHIYNIELHTHFGVAFTLLLCSFTL